MRNAGHRRAEAKGRPKPEAVCVGRRDGGRRCARIEYPIGNSLMMASTMLGKTDDLIRSLEQHTMRRAELVHYLALAREASELIMRGLNSAADLVQSFKQVAVDRTTAQRRTLRFAASLP